MDILTRKKIYQMYCDYKRELWLYTGQHFESELKEWFTEITEDPSMTIYPIKNAHIRAVIGFLIVQDLNENEQEESGCRWYISEAYVLPEHRRQRFMTTAVHEFVAQNKGNIGLVTINKNEKATIFWKRTLTSLGYSVETVKHLTHGNETFYRFSEPAIMQKALSYGVV